MFNYTIIIIFFTLVIAACSSHYKRPESVEDKMKRFTPRKNSSGMIPKIVTSSSWKHTTKRRGPASMTKARVRQFQSLTNKKVYFMTLLHQYNYLRPLSLANAPKVTSCPHFHGTLLDYKRKFKTPTGNGGITSKWSIDRQKLSSSEYIAKHPELSLSTTPFNKYPTLAETISKIETTNYSGQVHKYLVSAIQTHTNSNYNELQELCQTGSSDNYYAFENLVNFTQTERKMKPVAKDMSSLLKTSLFANHAILSSLGKYSPSRTIASNSKKQWYYKNPLMSEVTERIKAPWALDYFKQLKQN